MIGKHWETLSIEADPDHFVDADLVSRTESAVFLALVVLFVGTFVSFLIEFQRISGDST